jgi:hypothetical protein
VSKTRRKQWKCPHCPQTSSRHWNVAVHIKRAHDGIGDPIETTSNSASSITAKQLAPSVNSTEIRKKVYPGISDNRGYRDTNQNINRVEKEAINSTGSLEKFKKNIHEDIELLRLLAERQDLLRRISPSLSQQSMASLLPTQFLSNIFQANGMIGNPGLPTGYRVRFCNKCLEGNICEPVFGSIQMEALAKDMIGHYCMPEARAAVDQQQNKGDLIKRVHENLSSILINVVNLRLSFKGIRDGAYLKSQELDNEFLTQYPNKIFPIGIINRTWIKQEELIDLGPIINHDENNMNNEKDWAIRAVKKEGQHPEKLIKIDMSELKEFLRITKATFGAFRIRVGDVGPVRCFLISVVF